MGLMTEWQVKEQDIDWYCLVNGRLTHIASMGGTIPERFRDREKLRIAQAIVAGMEPFAEVILNENNIQSQVEKGYEYLQNDMIRQAVEDTNRNHPGFAYLRNYDLPIRLFAATFVEKARRGFRSFARREDGEGNEYILIAEPANYVDYKRGELHFEELNCELRENERSLFF